MRINSLILRTELIRKDITQIELSKMCGVSRTTINAIANGKSCKDEVAYKIANVLGISIAYLVTGDENA